MTDIDCLSLGLTETHPSDRKAWSGRLRSAVCCQTGSTPILGTNLVQYKLNSDGDGDGDGDKLGHHWLTSAKPLSEPVLQGTPFLKIITCPTLKSFELLRSAYMKYRRKICPNPLARLVVLLAPGRRAVGNGEPWCWDIVNWTFRNKLQWNLNRNSNIFIQENVFENVVWKITAILSWPQCVKGSLYLCYGLKLNGINLNIFNDTIDSEWKWHHKIYSYFVFNIV